MIARGIVAFVALVWIVFTVYFQSLYMALAFLTAVFTVFWYMRSLPIQATFNGQPPPSWWWWKYVLPVLLSIFATVALVGFAVNTTIGLMVMSFEAGVFLTGWLFTASEE